MAGVLFYDALCRIRDGAEPSYHRTMKAIFHHRGLRKTLIAAIAALSLGISSARAESTPAAPMITIQVSPAGLFVDGKSMDASQLEARLRELPSNTLATIRCEESTDHQRLVDVLDLLKRNSVTRISLESTEGRPRPKPVDSSSGISFDFAGGTVAQLIETLRKNNAPTFNLVGTKEQLALPLPAFSLRSAGSMALASVLDKLLQPNGATVDPSGSTSDAESMPIFVIRSLPQRSIQQSTFDCFPLAPLLDRYTPEQIAGAIQTAWELDPNFRKDSLRLKYHPETQLLFVVGNSPQPIAAASQIYKTLLQQRGAHSPAPTTEKKP